MSDDQRFSKAATDLRFRKAPRKVTKIQVDSRFKGMFEDDRFATIASVDRYGRPVAESKKKRAVSDLHRFYELDKEASDANSSDQASDSEAEAEEDEQAGNKQADAASSDEDTPAPSRPKVSGYDLARGLVTVESSDEEDAGEADDSDAEGTDADADEEELDAAVVLDRVDVPIGDATRRFACVNMDWDKIKAVHLLKLFQSFVPTGGSIISVTIFPSEFGKERLAYEAQYGPPRELFTSPNIDEKELREAEELGLTQEDLEHERMLETLAQRKHHLHARDLDTGEEGQVADPRLIKYQLERLRYYYAVVECDSVRTAMEVFAGCNDIEFEDSGNLVDLRYIPDDMDFEDEPHDFADSLPSNYMPTTFHTNALSHSTVRLTWDEDDHSKKAVLRRRLDEKDLDDIDISAYLASDSDDSSDDEQPGEKAPSRSIDMADDENDEIIDKSQRKKYSSLLKEISLENNPDQEMEITFNTELDDKVDRLVKERKKKNQNADKTVWEAYLDRRKEKRKERRKLLRQGASAGSDSEDAGSDAEDPEAAAEAALQLQLKLKQKKKKSAFGSLGGGFFDDAAAAGDDKQTEAAADMAKQADPFLAVQEPTAGSSRAEQRRAKQEAKQREADELALMMVGDGTISKQKHFDLREIHRAERLAGRKKLSSKDRARVEEVQSAEAGEDAFKFNPKDDRFTSMFDSHKFAIDPSSPHFKRTSAMDALIAERQSRIRKREAQEDQARAASKGAAAAAAATSASSSSSTSTGTSDSLSQDTVDISSMVERLKRKAGSGKGPAGKRSRL
ncbi:hypothetical protein H696_03404 [Fonticula alba]|uniref:Uncharacterized protein n=1 Tax=Fonticula alba TaxID=691883 RepID=A0A058Z6P1_FONAL|nr:hypothetical protein H696_03404 [Fonticula alba]KCV69939.1 hypothetical protein H696_03404 [Fonticula alba]|eukprot:XP_009495545.1 hypothetical protein H696_03404 [Fonticula alba]